jgi:xanthine dehydrogenase accessory protein XdhC
MIRSLGKAVEAQLANREPVMMVSITDAKGSTPRAAGTRMAVTAAQIFGTIGGGHLEFQATLHARRMLADGRAQDTIELALGPAMGQCCGGRVGLSLARADKQTAALIVADEAEAARAMPLIALFGAGHVGRALATALSPLPVRLLWADERPDAFPSEIDDSVEIASDEWSVVMNRDEPLAAVVVMTYDHGLDFEITEAALVRTDIDYVGLIGSATKRRRFETWFAKRGGEAGALRRLVSPIGDFGVADKRPEVIAALVAVEIMQRLFPS